MRLEENPRTPGTLRAVGRLEKRFLRLVRAYSELEMRGEDDEGEQNIPNQISYSQYPLTIR
jgi:hypothetical protein